MFMLILLLILVTKVKLMTRTILVKSCDLAVFIKKCLIMSKKKEKNKI